VNEYRIIASNYINYIHFGNQSLLFF